MERLIEIEVTAVLDPACLPEWWNTYIPALHSTPRVAYDRGDGEAVLKYAATYSDPSFG